MLWEIERHSWNSSIMLARVPQALMNLVAARTEPVAEKSYWQIDSVVVRNGRLLIGAEAVAACLVQALCQASKLGRSSILELLIQLGGGIGDDTPTGRDLTDAVRREVLLGLPAYAEILEEGDRADRFHCIDLLSICASIDAKYVDRIKFLLSKAAGLGEKEEMLVQAIMRDLDK